ncbi:hypothetical protein ACQKII_23605 [Lysinibacillus sp. NPDC048646]|uniref:hypothetical protein n=1 Tax=Lysinibacillus sp. NPDC048646 TaxID=3390574 RepID=UPI003D077CA0
MKTHSKIGKIIYFLGIFLLISGTGRSTGSLEYNLFIPNNSVALIYIFMGLAIIFASAFIKPQKN